MKKLQIIAFFILILNFGCTTRQSNIQKYGWQKIDIKEAHLTESDIIWSTNLDFYPNKIVDEMTANCNFITITHYEISELDSLIFFENRIHLDRTTGEIVNHELAVDTLNQMEIEDREKNYINAFRSKFRTLFVITPSSATYIDTVVKEQNNNKGTYSIKIRLNEKEYLVLNNLGIDNIDYYLNFTNELYIISKPKINDSLDLAKVYKYNLDELIDKYLKVE